MVLLIQFESTQDGIGWNWQGGNRKESFSREDISSIWPHVIFPQHLLTTRTLFPIIQYLIIIKNRSFTFILSHKRDTLQNVLMESIRIECRENLQWDNRCCCNGHSLSRDGRRIRRRRRERSSENRASGSDWDRKVRARRARRWVFWWQGACKYKNE